jgi:hypothetical protein
MGGSRGGRQFAENAVPGNDGHYEKMGRPAAGLEYYPRAAVRVLFCSVLHPCLNFTHNLGYYLFPMIIFSLVFAAVFYFITDWMLRET